MEWSPLTSVYSQLVTSISGGAGRPSAAARPAGESGSTVGSGVGSGVVSLAGGVRLTGSAAGAEGAASGAGAAAITMGDSLARLAASSSSLYGV